MATVTKCNLRSRFQVNVVTRNKSTLSIQLSFVPVFVFFDANNLDATTEYQFSHTLPSVLLRLPNNMEQLANFQMYS